MSRTLARMQRADDGMATAEYGVVTAVACGFGGILWALLNSGFGRQLLENLINKALGIVGF